ncbi:sugar phosphate isomerase/epimerase family protein [Kitasatospora sp. NPDC088783]|uniref:sugar phosphate isomerase/epimerase family protein n=1 Tax=Kitasatospora sp. NPDC088783 TaxID=3364077 RepID=UPI0038128255
MSGTAPGGIGVYSISVPGLPMPELLAWCARQGLAVVHLRGGPRGADLARREVTTLRAWRACAQAAGVVVTGVTADTDLADLLSPDTAVRRRATGEVAVLAEAAGELGASWVRLLARRPPGAGGFAAAEVPEFAVPLLAELHHPGWLDPGRLAALEGLLGRTPHLRLLADTLQLGAAVDAAGAGAGGRLERVMEWVRVVHLSDDGSGLDGSPGRRVVAEAAAALAAGGRTVEVALEWTGQPRTPARFLTLHQQAVDFWDRAHRSTGRP